VTSPGPRPVIQQKHDLGSFKEAADAFRRALANSIERAYLERRLAAL
jgi:hypothetical protein